MRVIRLFRWGLCLVVLAGCEGMLTDYSGALCDPDGTCPEGYHCMTATGRCQLGLADALETDAGTTARGDAGTPDAGICSASVNACVHGDGCCPPGCHAGIDNDCQPACGNASLEPGESCDDGNTDAEDDCLGDCKPNTCGDGTVNRKGTHPEACDDGNTVTETSCPYGTPRCTSCNATCTSQQSLTGPYCGDSSVNGPEACDDGNTVTETSCPYGTPRCTVCDAICSAKLNLTGPTCGDDRVNGPEACDDGNTVNETECPYGEGLCTYCNSTCTGTLKIPGPYCGDGIVSDGEVCDPGQAIPLIPACLVGVLCERVCKQNCSGWTYQ